ILLLLLTSTIFAQQEKFQLQAKVVDKNGQPISDVYIVNLVSREKDISRPNGIIDIRVSSSDSIVLSHISYFRKVVKVHTLLINPVVVLESENVNIGEVTVSPEQKSQLMQAQENLKDIKEFDFPLRPKIDEESNPVNELMTEHNRVLRTEASSITMIRFTPGDVLNKWKKKREKKKKSREFYSTRKQKKEKED
ncbi:MAG: hypothetical protein R3182_11665, partial [Draconibacterium sp.]|nr:hypothetical protein [Draconibacterium sp.]